MCDQNDSVRYDIVADDEGAEALQVFWLNPETGVIMAIRPIANRESSQYAVSMPNLSPFYIYILEAWTLKNYKMS